MDLLVGTYSSGAQAKGEGIHAVSFDPHSGTFGAPRLLAPCVNPSWLVLAPDGQTLFAVSEVASGDRAALLSFALDAEGGAELLSEVAIGGAFPCHLAFDETTRRLASAQYGTGDIAVCRVVDGVIAAPTIIERSGSGPNPRRQEGPHAHWVTFTDGGEVLHAVDLGTDSVVSYRLDADDRPAEVATLQLPPGCGPRHMCLSQDGVRAFLFCELDESLISLTRSGLGWQMVDVREGFARPADEDGAGAEIRLSPDERFLYLSGRRQSRIACFSLEGGLTPVGEIDCGGKWPRDFIVAPGGDWLIVAGQHSDNLASLRRDTTTGRLEAGHSCMIGSPVAVISRDQA